MYHLHVQAVGQDRQQGRGVDHQDLGGHRLLVRAEGNIVILLYFYIARRKVFQVIKCIFRIQNSFKIVENVLK